jgi:hypothetical protein
MVLSDDEFIQPAHDFQRGRHLIKTKDTHTHARQTQGKSKTHNKRRKTKTRRKTVHKTKARHNGGRHRHKAQTEDKTQVSQEEGGSRNRPLRSEVSINLRFERNKKRNNSQARRVALLFVCLEGFCIGSCLTFVSSLLCPAFRHWLCCACICSSSFDTKSSQTVI